MRPNLHTSNTTRKRSCQPPYIALNRYSFIVDPALMQHLAVGIRRRYSAVNGWANICPAYGAALEP